MTTDSRLHVVFGTGPVGLTLIDELVSRRQSVRVVNRSGRADTPEGVEIRAGDASDPAFATEACAAADVVYQCLNPPYTDWPRLFPPLQRAVLGAAEAVGARLVAMENLYAYGPTGGRPLTEDLPHAPTGPKGRTRAAMARELLEAHEQGRLPVSVGRASDFFGPRGLMSSLGERVFYPLLAGKKAQVLGNPDLPHTYSYLPDIARGLATLGEEDAALGQAWHLPNAETTTTRAMVERIAAVAGTDASIQAMPKLMARMVGLFNRPLRELLEVWYGFDEPYVVDSSKFEEAFGRHATPLDDAVATTVNWFREHPRP